MIVGELIYYYSFNMGRAFSYHIPFVECILEDACFSSSYFTTQAQTRARSYTSFVCNELTLVRQESHNITISGCRE